MVLVGVMILTIYEYEYERCVLFYSLRRTSLNKKTEPYVQRLHSEAPYWPSPVTGKAGFSCYRKPTMYGFVSSGYILDKDPLWVVHVSMCVAQTAHNPDKVSFAPLSVRIFAIGLYFHLIIQGDTGLSHHVFWSSVPPFSSPMLDYCSQGRVRTKLGSSYKCQPTPFVVL